MSTHKAGGKTRQHTSPAGKRLGAKVSTGQRVKAGNVLVRQRGGTVNAGLNTRFGRDYTVFAMADGVVKFGTRLGKKIVSVI